MLFCCFFVVVIKSCCCFVCRHRLCAPIASLDCMEEFSGNTGHDMSMFKLNNNPLN